MKARNEIDRFQGCPSCIYIRSKTSPKEQKNRWKKERARRAGELFVRGQKGRAEPHFVRAPHTTNKPVFSRDIITWWGKVTAKQLFNTRLSRHILLILEWEQGLSSPKIVFCVVNPSNKYVPKLFETAPDSSRDCWKDTWVTGQVPMHIKWPTTIPRHLIFEWWFPGVKGLMFRGAR